MSMRLTATPETCYWGYLDSSLPTVMHVDSGTEITIEAVTHHSGDAPDLLMDDGVRAIWDGIPIAERGPGAHIMTGPIHVTNAEPGDTLRVEILSMKPRFGYGSNFAGNWGLFYNEFGKERVTIYELIGPPANGSFPSTARPVFGFDFKRLESYNVPGIVTPPDPGTRRPFSRSVDVAVRPHLGIMGVAPEGGRVSSKPPGVFGGNVDNWRFGAGATVYYPVFTPGAGFYVGDPHFAQGDGEICGTAIEASLDVTLRLSLVDNVSASSPLLLTESQWYTHGFGDELDEAMKMAADLALRLLVDRGGFSLDEAYSLASVAVDLGVTQVVDGKVGCHAAIPRSLFEQ